MILLIAAQDIRFITLGLVHAGALVREQEETAPPERYLEAVDRTLIAWKIEPHTLKAIAVVVGPGAFTSSRVSTVIANSIAFAAGIPVIALENPQRLPLSSLVSLSIQAIPPTNDGGNPQSFAQPVYNRPPNSTEKNHKLLVFGH